MPDKAVHIAEDPVKKRLRELRRSPVLTPRETKEAIDGIIDYMELD